MEFENAEPFARHALAVSPTGIGLAKVPAFWLRLRVKNVGRSVARECEGKLVSIVQADNMEERKDFDPVILHWVGTSRIRIDINRDEYEYLDLAYTTTDQPDRITIYAMEEALRGINLRPPRQDYLLHIVLYGTNVEPLPRTYRLRNGADFDQLRLELIPD